MQEAYSSACISSVIGSTPPISLLHIAIDGAELTLVIVFNSVISGSETVILSVMSGGGIDSATLDALDTLVPSGGSSVNGVDKGLNADTGAR